MRIVLTLVLIAAPLGIVQAGEISSDHRGAWALNGECKQARQIIISEKTIKLVARSGTRTLTDGEEAVFNGKTLINASMPRKGDEEAVLAFSGQLVDEAGKMKLLLDAQGNEAGFSGAFIQCKRDSEPARRMASNKPKWVAPKRMVTRMARLASRPVSYSSYPGRQALLGGLY